MRIFIAGHKGMVGSSITKLLSRNSKNTIITADRDDLNLLDQGAVKNFFANNNIDQVYLAAAKVGGIHANNIYPAEYIYENLMIQTNIIHSAHLADVQKLLFLGSSCIYPKLSEQPIKEDFLLTGPLEPTNEPYAIAKIAGIKLCESYNRQYGRDYRSVMPTNLYGPNDNFHQKNSHVIPGLINRFHQAVKEKSEKVIIWGSGMPKREFLYVDDMSSASVHIMSLDNASYNAITSPMLSHINVGSGVDCTIKELAKAIAKVTKFDGKLTFDKSKPDGTPKKLMDISKLRNTQWSQVTSLEKGLVKTYDWYLENEEKLRLR